MFRKLDGDTAVLVQGGVYKTVDLYERDGKLFAAAAGGYVRLHENGSTSKDKLQIESLQIEAPLYKDRFGRLTVVGGPERKPLPEAAASGLLIGKD